MVKTIDARVGNVYVKIPCSKEGVAMAKKLLKTLEKKLKEGGSPNSSQS